MSSIQINLVQNSDTSVKVEMEGVDVVVDRPVEKGGGGKGMMGGQYLLIGIGGCFCSTFFAAAQAREILLKGFKVQVSAVLSEDVPKRFTEVTLSASCEQCSAPEEFEKLLKIAENACISVNTVKNGMQLKVLSPL